MSINMITKRQWLYFALILMLHITILDMFLLTAAGPRMLWDDSMQWFTWSIHIGIVAISCVILWCVYKLQQRITNRKTDS